ncbi:metallophosphoesterase [Candidatus Woesearchaeota archaeon]|nr:metallophosphoesterase [Candidatus Woesearchaeota archaeon]
MITKNKVGLYGVFWVFIGIVAILQFSKGINGVVTGTGIISVGLVIFSVFVIFIKPKVRIFKELLDIKEEEFDADDLSKSYQSIKQHGSKTIKAVKGVKENIPDISSKIRQTCSTLKTKLTSKQARKETVGEQINAVAEVTQEVEKTLEELAESTDQRSATGKLLSVLIGELEAEHKEVASKIEELQDNKEDFGRIEQLLKDNLERCRKVLTSEDLEVKIRELHGVEELIAREREEKIDDKLQKELIVAEQQSHYLKKLQKRTHSTIKQLQAAIHPDGRDKNYQEMQARLDNMETISDSLATVAEDHAKLVMNIIQSMRNADRQVQQLHLLELQQEKNKHIGLAENAKLRVIEADKKAEDFSKILRSSQAENTELKKRVDELFSSVARANMNLNAWRKDLKTAKEAIKGDKDLETLLANLNTTDSNKKIDLINRLVKAVIASDENASNMLESKAAAEAQVNELNRKVAALKEEKNNTENALSAAKEENKEFRRNIIRKEEMISEINLNFSKEVDDETRKRYGEELEKLGKEKQEMQIKLRESTNDCSIRAKEIEEVKSSLAASQEKVKALEPQLSDLTRETKDALKQKDNVQAELKRIQKEFADQKDDLTKKISELEEKIVEERKRFKKAQEEKNRLSEQADKSHKAVQEQENRTSLAWDATKRLEEQKKEHMHVISEMHKLVEKERKNNDNLHTAISEANIESRKALRHLNGLKQIYAQELSTGHLQAEELTTTNLEFERNIRNLEDSLMTLKDRKLQLESLPEDRIDTSTEDEIKDFIHEIAELTKAIKEDKKDLGKSKELARSMEERAEHAEERINIIEEERLQVFQDLESSNAELENLRKNNEADTARHHEEVDKLQGKILELEANIENIQESIKNASSVIDNAEEIEHREQELAELIDEYKELISKRTQVQELTVRRVHALRKIQTDYQNNVKETEQLSEEKAILESELEEAKRRENNLLNENKRLIDEENVIKTIELVPKELEELKEKLRTTEEELKNTQASRGQLKEVINAAAERIHQLESTQQVLKPIIDVDITSKTADMRQKVEEELQISINTKITLEVLDRVIRLKDTNPSKTIELIDDSLPHMMQFDKNVNMHEEEKSILTNTISRLQEIKSVLETSIAMAHPIVAKPIVIAIGDVHGDWKKLKEVMNKAGVLEGDRWSAPKGTKVVLLGDYIDRGEETFEVLYQLMKLKQKAGEQLVMLIGNHEAMFLGAFDWEGFDKPKIFESYLAEEQSFEQNTNGEEDAVRQWNFNNTTHKFRQLYLRLRKLKISWLGNELIKNKNTGLPLYNEQGEVQSHVLNSLGLNFNDLLKDSRLIFKTSYKDIPMKKYIEFLRKNLVSHYMDDNYKVLFVHAGIPFHADNMEDLSDNPLIRTPGDFVNRQELNKLLADLDNRIKKKDINFMITATELSPLTAAEPVKRSYEWYDIYKKYWKKSSEENEARISSLISDSLKFSAVVHGHSRHRPNEDNLQSWYTHNNRIRREYNIDFGMSKGYKTSPGGWLVLNNNKTIDVNIITDTDVNKYTYKLE